jgi:hypothetical protein
MVIACHVRAGHCDDRSPQSRAVAIESHGGSAAYRIREVAAGEYLVVGLMDRNGNGAEDAGDWAGEYVVAGRPATIIPPAVGVDLRLSAGGVRPVGGPVASAPRAARPTAPGPVLPPGRRLEGLYVGTTRNLVAPGAGGGVSSGVTWTPGRDWIAFLPDGRAFAGLPEEGLAEPLAWDDLCAAHSDWCARYELRGDRVRLRWASGDELEYRLDADGTLWTPDRLNYDRLDPLDGLRPDGRFVSVGNEYRTGWIRLRPDGTFVESRFLQDTGWKEIGSHRELTEAERVGGSGSYRIAGNTLELRYADGRVARMAVYTSAEQARARNPELLYFNGWDYHRER